MLMDYKYWLIACVAFVILEILPPPTHFFFVCMAFGALGASIAALFSSSVWLPWVVFAVMSVALTPLMIPLAKFLFTPKPHASNVDALLGQKALVTGAIYANTPGTVKIHGESWRAVSEGDTFEKDQWVEINRVEGASVIVRRTS
jgi:membrane protein implicated in regulation of membrane protease activity